MREIKFRGFNTGLNEWVYGCYVVHKKEHWIYRQDDKLLFLARFVAVDPKTVGQFTGLKDKNGKEIYERDIVKFTGAFDRELGAVSWQCEGAIGWYVESSERRYGFNSRDAFEVIGNIYENPELLK